jgi:choline dehydrogenase-like flavoprotein
MGALEETPGLSAGAWQMRPLSRGYVEAKSSRPSDMPAINPRYLSEETDRRAIIGGLRFARRLFDAPALKKFVREESLPGRHIESDDELLDYARRNGGTCYHASCTCMMGQHPMAVVDDELRVHGLEGLRVIDTSVMPAVTSTNTNAPTIVIAEKGAAIIKGASRQKNGCVVTASEEIAMPDAIDQRPPVAAAMCASMSSIIGPAARWLKTVGLRPIVTRANSRCSSYAAVRMSSSGKPSSHPSPGPGRLST